MNTEFWIERWQTREIGFHQPRVNDYLQAWWPSLGLPPDTTVFVPLCGKSIDMHWLRERGHRVIGVEVAREAVRDFFAEWQVEARVAQQGSFERWEHDGITVLCGDFFDLQPHDLATVSAVFDRAALIALPATLRVDYVGKMSDVLPAQCTTLLVAIDYPQAQMSGPPFAVDNEEVLLLFAQSRIALLQESDVLNEPDNARFQARGLTQLIERVYRIGTAGLESRTNPA